jgi:hypothetical protein
MSETKCAVLARAMGKLHSVPAFPDRAIVALPGAYSKELRAIKDSHAPNCGSHRDVHIETTPLGRLFSVASIIRWPNQILSLPQKWRVPHKKNDEDSILVPARLSGATLIH